MKEKNRCPWPIEGDELYIKYHDEEWGVPVHDDRRIFEFLVLESFQSGLSWRTILYKRENFRKAFAGFDFRKVAKFGERDYRRLMGDAGIVRNRLKIQSAINNAKKFLEVRQEFGSFDKYIWGWVDGAPLIGRRKTMKDMPAKTEVAEALAKDLKKRGFRFLGPTVVYAHMQAAGMVNDHMVSCFRYKLLGGL
jgi:DNA-3-methyladenine glycosylase I